MDAGSPATPDRILTGRIAEGIAAGWLELLGWRILERNLQVGHKEIDLLAREGACLVFVEVRFRRSDRYGSASESLVAAKRGRLARAIAIELKRRGWSGDYRLDLVAIDMQSGRAGLGLRHHRGLWGI